MSQLPLGALERLGRSSLFVTLALALASQFASPARAQIAVAGDLIYIQEDARPGDSYRGTLTLRNQSTAAATATIYINDVVFEGDVQAFLEPGSHPRSNADWIELELGSVQIEAGESATVGYTVSVPDDPGLHDSYWSMVMVENAPVGEAAAAQGVRIRSVTRYGIYLVTNARARTPVQLAFTNPSLKVHEQDGWAFSVSLVNSGQRLVWPDSYLDLYDGGGEHVRRFEGEPPLVFPEERVGQTFRLANLAPGEYTGIVVVDAGGEDVFGARYTLRVGTP
ncbi:MAG: hypothetical protein WD314_09890 [Trueperaceae bacterium]